MECSREQHALCVRAPGQKLNRRRLDQLSGGRSRPERAPIRCSDFETDHHSSSDGVRTGNVTCEFKIIFIPDPPPSVTLSTTILPNDKAAELDPPDIEICEL